MKKLLRSNDILLGPFLSGTCVHCAGNRNMVVGRVYSGDAKTHIAAL